MDSRATHANDRIERRYERSELGDVGVRVGPIVHRYGPRKVREQCEILVHRAVLKADEMCAAQAQDRPPLRSRHGPDRATRLADPSAPSNTDLGAFAERGKTGTPCVDAGGIGAQIPGVRRELRAGRGGTSGQAPGGDLQIDRAGPLEPRMLSGVPAAEHHRAGERQPE